MKKIAIFRHAASEGPGYLADFLDARGLPWQLIRIDADDKLPVSAREFSGMVFMGGPMSVNDDLPWIQPVLSLIRESVATNIPVLGHCLGGQLMSKALGGVVGRNPIKEIGWGELIVDDHAEAKRWFGENGHFQGFHWHGETFTQPDGAIHLLSSAYCQNQAYSIGKHLAFQCHIEMTLEMVHEWCRNGAEEINQSASSPAVQSIAEIEKGLESHLAKLNLVAQGVYSRWVEGLV